MLRKFLQNCDGNVALIVSIAAIPILIGIGAAIDFAQLTSHKSNLQDALDGAVLTAAAIDNKTEDERALMGNLFLTQNTKKLCVDEADFFFEGDMVTANASCTIDNALLGRSDLTKNTISVSAMAQRSSSSGGNAMCVIALDLFEKKTLLASGGTTLNANQCSVQVNSGNTKAVVLSGGSTLNSSENCIVGGVEQGLSNMSPQPTVDCEPIDDPFASATKPVVGACNHVDFNENSDTTLYPGVYCGGMRVSNNTFTFMPGLYIIKNGTFESTGGATLQGDGVTFFLTGTAEEAGIVWSGGGAYDFSASKNGPLAGFVVYLDPNALKDDKSVISGGGDVRYEGAFYFPKQTLLISGGGSVATPSPFTAYVANVIKYTGGSSLNIRIDPDATSVPIPQGFYKNTTQEARLIR
ncbi:hypothetical protein GCM10009069_21930 [Algimonas arctica]|uniref:Putative Flp pilus-assembly TadG-like N-terminal domain-containing protein n=1 Tax=Algimonas arctica TaxID=1479486 RepID=A0A8J3CTH9_9PROT|nr:Tad domain-containing protein [Algimonas arctica]GHA98620.1 hypothetical protein GCM10009069_21930 [Algimonas arctica]